MDIVTQIDNDRLIAMKSRDELKLSTLRMLSAALKNAQIAKQDKLTDDEVQQVLRSEIKKRKEASDAFNRAGDKAKADQELSEKKFIEEYLPPDLTEKELVQLINEVLSGNDLTQPSQFGQAMGLVMKKVAGRADGKVVQSKIKELLDS